MALLLPLRAEMPKILAFRCQFWVAAISGLALAACGGGLQGDRIAQTIKDDVVSLGGTSLKSVTCPPQITPQKDATFECTGELTTGYTFTIKVTQRDDKGTLAWDVPNTPSLLNVSKIEGLIQDSLKAELGTSPTVDCDGTYKPIQPGQRFECKLQLVAKAADTAGGNNKAKKPAVEKIAVIVDEQGGIGWQRVFKDAAPKTGKAASATNPSNANTTSPSNSPDSSSPASATQPANPDVAPVPVSSPAIAPSPRPAQRPVASSQAAPDKAGASSEPTYQDTLKWED